MLSDAEKVPSRRKARNGRYEFRAISKSHIIYIRTTGNELLANCIPDSGVFLYVPPSLPQLKELYATLRAAPLADKRVTVRINEGTNPCTVAYVTLDRQ